MNVHRLSSAPERISAVAVCTILTALMGLLLYVLRGEILTLILTGAAALLVAAVLVFYLMNLFKASCEADPGKKRLTVRGIPSDCLDLTQAASIKTVSCSTGPITTRTLIFSDCNGQQVAALPTFFTAHQGAQAEPLAALLAQELGLVFEPSLEPWEYDKAQRAEHQKQEAQARSDARKAKYRALKAKFSPRKAAEASVSASPEEELPAQGGETVLESDGINYDALDDEK